MAIKLDKRTTNIIFGALAAIIVIALIWKFIIKPMRDRQVADAGTGGGTGSSGSGSTGVAALPKLGNNATLKKGTKSQEVAWVQSYYNSQFAGPLGKTKLTVDGIFGSKTEAAVKTTFGSTSTTWTAYKAALDSGGLSTGSSNTTDQYSGNYDYSAEYGFTGQYGASGDSDFPWTTAP